MRVTVAAGGRFWFYELAQQLLKRGHLNRLIASQPKFMVRKWGIPGDKIRTVLAGEVIAQAWRRMPFRESWRPDNLVHEIFDRLAAGQVGSPDVFDGLASFSLHSIRAAKKSGAVTVVTRGSSHIEYQNQVLGEEYRQYSIPKIVVDQANTEKDVREYAEADYISIPSLFAKRTFLERGIPESKLIVVPYGVDLSLFRQLPKEDGVFRVILTGGMTLRKGVHHLLQAFTELKLPNSELMLIGSMNEEMRPFFDKYSGHFRHMGHVPQAELHKLYSQGSVFCLPSIEDGFGMVIVQAMACGLPVIASENTGGPDLVENSKEGFIIPIRDVEKLKEKILYLYEHPKEQARMGEAAKAKVSEGFTWDDYGDRMVAEYSRILQKA
jgi:glycosyltransferase involved in cell wall biosynthesis